MNILKTILLEHQHDYGLFENHWFLALSGWVAYNLFLMLKEQRIFDKNKDGYDWREITAFLKYHNISLLLSFTLIPTGVVFAEDIWTWVMDKPFTELAYFGVGCLSILFQAFVKYLTKRFNGNSSK